MPESFHCIACNYAYRMKPKEPWPTECPQCQSDQNAKVVPLANPIMEDDFMRVGIPQLADTFVKHDNHKLQWHLLPPQCLEGVVRVLMHGAEKYDDFNWSKGTDYSRYYDALKRHVEDWWKGEDLDESGENHLDHAMCCLIFLRYFQLYPDAYARFDDRLLFPTALSEKV